MTTKTIYEVKKVNGKEYSREVGVDTNLLELIEDMESCNYELDTDSSWYRIPPSTGYVVTVNGKEVDAKDVHVQLFDNDPPVYFYDADGEEVHEDELLTDEDLMKLSKQALVKKIRELEE